MTPRVIVLFVATLSSGVVHAQGIPATSSPEVEKLRMEVESGRPEAAVLDAGRSGSPEYIPYLKTLLKKLNRKKFDGGGYAQLALAKLGEKEQLQQILCEADFGSASIQNHAITSKLKYVGGWFSIQVLFNFLQENPKYHPLLQDSRGDFAYLPPSSVAPQILPEIVPNPPPIPAPLPLMLMLPEKVAPQRQAWREWIQQNQSFLQKLLAIGDGVEASERVCKRVLKKDRFIDRSNLEH